MYPILIEIFGRQISTFGLFMIFGAAAAWIMIKILDSKKDKDVPLVFLICICGGFVGAFLFRPITRIPEVIINWEQIRQIPFMVFIPRFFGEIVFYGGLIGGAAAMLIYCRYFKVPMLPIADLFAPALAVAHGIGRVGCFFGGCCYGMPVQSTHPFAMVFPPASIGAPAGVPLLATQLIEAACLFALAAILVFIYKKTAGTGLAVCLYGLLYSVLRFIIEFYRGDSVRGIYGPLSTSQYISIALFAISLVLLYVIINKHRKRLFANTQNDNIGRPD